MGSIRWPIEIETYWVEEETQSDHFQRSLYPSFLYNLQKFTHFKLIFKIYFLKISENNFNWSMKIFKERSSCNENSEFTAILSKF